MIEIPYTKLHGAENDFLLTWGDAAPRFQLPEIARRICARTTGIGADGWMLVWKENNGLRTKLFNSDGSEPEISGNGTRCAAAFGIAEGAVDPPQVRVLTGAGQKTLRLVSRKNLQFLFEMDMGTPQTEQLRMDLQLTGQSFDATVLNVGNPQCAIFVDSFSENWRSAAREAEGHSLFPQRTNVSFVRVIDRHTIEAVFYERGAGETRSSGTGATGAGVAAILRNEAESPVEVRTPAGSLRLRWDESVYLTGPAELIGEGRFFLDL
ncbi:MAG: diaminopimelate epimerase [Acidobacteriaceae bacterium]|nr:diaminopimelate epimerase [Acidobacteriaceae bacterium]MBV9676119.1 diaminopimelate epimerase [Acidobacteriaceae bacterium]